MYPLQFATDAIPHASHEKIISQNKRWAFPESYADMVRIVDRT